MFSILPFRLQLASAWQVHHAYSTWYENTISKPQTTNASSHPKHGFRRLLLHGPDVVHGQAEPLVQPAKQLAVALLQHLPLRMLHTRSGTRVSPAITLTSY